MNWLKAFFAVDNQVNENTAIGVVLLIALLLAVFVKGLGISQEAIYTLAGMTMACFGLSLGKK